MYFALVPRVSVRTTPVPAVGPSFVKVTVKTIWSPSFALVAPEELVTTSSAGGPTIDPVTVAVLFAVLGSVVLASLLTEAVSEKPAPGVRVVGAETTRVKVKELPE